MSETIREKIEEIITQFLDNLDEDGHDSYLGNNPSNRDAIIEAVNTKILALFPSWRTFSNDCKPEEGQRVAIKQTTGKVEEFIYRFTNSQLKDCIAYKQQWYPIP